MTEEQVLQQIREFFETNYRQILAAGGAHVLTPRALETDWGMTEGHLFQGEEALDQFFTMRPILGWARHRTPVRGLYLCGAGTHPGGGLTGANGRNAAKAVLADRKG